MLEPVDNLIFDVTNLLYRTFYAYKSEDDQTLAGLAHHAALTTCFKYYKKYKPKQIIMAFDRPNWRKQYTQSDKCVSGMIYKGNRRLNQTQAEKKKFENFLEHIAEFEHLMEEQTSVVVLATELLEADDLIALYTQINPTKNNVIISSDKDLLQLITPQTILVSPIDGKQKTLKEWDNDPKYFIFEKCFRGDRSDNVCSAYPGIRKTKIKAAYTDEFLFTNIMNESWTHANGKTFVVKDLFEENQLLMDLTKQPQDIQKAGIKTILHQTQSTTTFNYFNILQFCGKYGLKRVSERIEDFIPMLNL